VGLRGAVAKRLLSDVKKDKEQDFFKKTPLLVALDRYAQVLTLLSA